jgi:hypothetical protein
MPKGIKGSTPTFTCLNCGAEQKCKLGHNYRNKYCNSKCSGEHKNKLWYETNRPLYEQGLLTSRFAYKRFIIEDHGNQCAICNQQPEHNGKSLVMILDHIDGDASNNKPENFRLVCPNCDTQLDTYKARNRGNGRQSKGMKWYSQL